MDSGLIKTIQGIHFLEDQTLGALLEKIVLLEYPARYKLIKEGSVAKSIFLVEKGAIRSYYLKKGNEITTWFTFENEFITSFYSLISKASSYETIELLEDSMLYGLSFDDLDILTNKFPAINQLYRRVLEINFIKQEKKLAERFDNAAEKYQDLISNYPQIVQRVPLGYIASYLGITQSTLSRIRRK